MRLARLAFLSILLSGMATLSAPADEKPNILLICVDDLKPNIGCYGDSLAKTPNIDQLAKRSFVFKRAYCNQAVCSPSRNALLVGLRPETLGIYDLPTNFRKSVPDAITLPQYFKTNGYQTQALGKLFHVGHGNIEDEASWSKPHFRPMRGQYAVAENVDKRSIKKTDGSSNPANGPAYERANVDDSRYTDGQIADEAIERIQSLKMNPGQPFFLAVGFLKPHLPFCAPEKYWQMHDSTPFEVAAVQNIPKDSPAYAGQPGGELRSYEGIPAKGDLPEDLQKRLIHGYYACTSYMDAQVGRVLAALEESGLSKNTIVVFWGDHGWHLGDHGFWCKHTNYEQAARIPLMIAMPTAAVASSSAGKGGPQDAFIESVDIYPTLCDLAALPTPKGLDGKSVANLLLQKSYQPKDYISHVYPRGKQLGRAIRTFQYRLVEWRDHSQSESATEYELYDYVNDPAETANIAALNPKVVEELKAILVKHPAPKPQIKSGESISSAPAKPSQDRRSMFLRRDSNNDGFLSQEEFLKNQPDPDKAPDRFKKFDVNEDSKLSESEFVTSGKR